MEKGQVASSFFIAAVIVFCIPMFVQGAIFGIIAKILAGIIMAAGIVWLIAGDHIKSILDKKKTAPEAVNVSNMYANMDVAEIRAKGEIEIGKRLAEAATIRAQSQLVKEQLELKRIKVEEGRKSDLLARMGVDPFGAETKQSQPKHDYMKAAKEGFDGTEEKPRKQLGDLRDLF